MPAPAERRTGRRWLALAACAALVPLAPPAQGSAQAPPASAIDAALYVEPARPGLDAVPLPALATLEGAVAEQIRIAADALTAGTAPRSARDLAARYGALAMVLHAYELFGPAEAAYGNARRLDPGDVRWRYLSGYLYEQTGRLEEAASAFEAVRREPGPREAAVRLGGVYLQLNRLRDAREQYESVREVFPALARNGLGEVALRVGRFEEAVEHFRAVLARVPTAAAVHYPLAMAYRGLGRMDEAREHLAQRGTGVVTLGDPLVDALQSLVRGERGLVMKGRRAFDAGLFDQAAAAFGEAVAAAPGSAVARMNLGLALARLGRGADAASALEAALRLEPGSVEARAALGLVLADQGRDADALVHLRDAFDRGADDPAVRIGLVAALMRSGRTDEAIIVLERARAADPGHEDTLVSLAILLADRQRFGEAITVLEDAHRAHPDRAATATTLSRLLSSSPDRSLRNGRRALDIARAVYASEPSAVHAESVALALSELGRCPEAADWMRRAVAAAREAGSPAEAERLMRELPRFDEMPCRR